MWGWTFWTTWDDRFAGGRVTGAASLSQQSLFHPPEKCPWCRMMSTTPAMSRQHEWPRSRSWHRWWVEQWRPRDREERYWGSPHQPTTHCWPGAQSAWSKQVSVSLQSINMMMTMMMSSYNVGSPFLKANALEHISSIRMSETFFIHCTIWTTTTISEVCIWSGLCWITHVLEAAMLCLLPDWYIVTILIINTGWIQSDVSLSPHSSDQ